MKTIQIIAMAVLAIGTALALHVTSALRSWANSGGEAELDQQRTFRAKLLKLVLFNNC